MADVYLKALFSGKDGEDLRKLCDVRGITPLGLVEYLVKKELRIFRSNVAVHGPTGKPE